MCEDCEEQLEDVADEILDATTGGVRDATLGTCLVSESPAGASGVRNAILLVNSRSIVGGHNQTSPATPTPIMARPSESIRTC